MTTAARDCPKTASAGAKKRRHNSGTGLRKQLTTAAQYASKHPLVEHPTLYCKLK